MIGPFSDPNYFLPALSHEQHSFLWSSSWLMKLQSIPLLFVVSMYIEVFGNRKKAKYCHAPMKLATCMTCSLSRPAWKMKTGRTDCWTFTTGTFTFHKIFVRSWCDFNCHIVNYTLPPIGENMYFKGEKIHYFVSRRVLVVIIKAIGFIAFK